MEDQVKTTRRIFAIVMALAFVLVAACQTIDGACWLPDGQGQGSGASGPILPTGAGGYGDTPPGSGGYGAGYVPCPTQQQEQPAPLSQLVCPARGATCASACESYGVNCPAWVENHVTGRINMLWACCNCKPGWCFFQDFSNDGSGCKSGQGGYIKDCWGPLW
jgi:hypothetical protein